MAINQNKFLIKLTKYFIIKCLMLDYAQFATRMKDEIIVAKLGRFVVQRHFQLKGK